MTGTQFNIYVITAFVLGWSAAPHLDKHPAFAFALNCTLTIILVYLIVKNIREKIQKDKK